MNIRAKAIIRKGTMFWEMAQMGEEQPSGMGVVAIMYTAIPKRMRVNRTVAFLVMEPFMRDYLFLGFKGVEDGWKAWK